MASSDSSQAAESFVVLCPSCRGKCRAPASAAGKMFRCPRCRATFRAAPEQSDPEYARAPAARHKPVASPPRHLDDDEGDGNPYAAHAPDQTRTPDVPAPDPIEDVEERRKAPPAPLAPLWLGVYDFPWHPVALRAWIMFGMGFAIVALLSGVAHYTASLIQHDGLGGLDFGQFFFIAWVLYLKGVFAFLIWTGLYAGSFFLATIEETGAGNQKMARPDYGFGERLMHMLYLLGIFALSAVPLGMVATIRPDLGSDSVVWSLVPSLILVFPILLLCSLANDSIWMVWNMEVIRGFLVRPHLLLILYVMSALLVAPCVALTYLTIVRYGSYLFLAPLAGFAWSTFVLIYGRLLGRVAWIVSGNHAAALHDARRRRKRKRRTAD